MDLYQRHGPALVRKARRLLSNQADAQDIVQALFVDLLASGHTDVDLPYLYRAVTHRCLSLLRDQKNRARLLAREEPALRGVVRTRCDDEAIGIDLIAKVLAELDARSAELLVYRYFDDLSQDEIAELVGVSRKTVGKLLQTVRAVVSRVRAEGDRP
ncbi:MAG TPA: sigma-70 family RNA polymerase sigma factor [Polyangiales bacterium]|nr:sigma-70 family RNA polymerase sigma factor [Polyangiales bacterium]